MKITGFLKTSMIDYPDTLASVVYLPGCNYRCPYCHNGDLVLGGMAPIDLEVIIGHLSKRKNLVGALVITGGEPTLQEDLPDFIKRVKAMGLKVKLDTNGSNPGMLKGLIQENLIDYVAMDLKNQLSKYPKTVGLDLVDSRSIEASLNIIKASCIPYEFRTTLMKDFHTPDDVMAMGALLAGSKRLVLQQYTYSDKQLVKKQFQAYTLEEMQMLKKTLWAYDISHIQLRGRV